MNYTVYVIDTRTKQKMSFHTHCKGDANTFAGYYRRQNKPKNKRWEVSVHKS